MRARARWVFAALALPAFALAAPIARDQLTALCADAEDQAQCGRLVEARQLTRLSRIAERLGDELRVSLSPFGLTIFRDTVNVTGATSYAVWDYLENLDTLVLFTTDGDRSGFLLLQRRGGEEYRVPSEPVIAPDERHFATADFCAKECDNRVTVWRIERNEVRKMSTWMPAKAWSDVSVTWRDAETIALEYSLPDDPQPRTLLRRLGDPSWQSVSTK
jgi:hypothetical protein